MAARLRTARDLGTQRGALSGRLPALDRVRSVRRDVFRQALKRKWGLRGAQTPRIPSEGAAAAMPVSAKGRNPLAKNVGGLPEPGPPTSTGVGTSFGSGNLASAGFAYRFSHFGASCRAWKPHPPDVLIVSPGHSERQTSPLIFDRFTRTRATSPFEIPSFGAIQHLFLGRENSDTLPCFRGAHWRGRAVLEKFSDPARPKAKRLVFMRCLSRWVSIGSPNRLTAPKLKA